MSKILVIYFKDDTETLALRLQDHLKMTFGSSNVLVGTASFIELGEDWLDSITHKVNDATVILALIGPDWLTHVSNGKVWLEDSEDYDYVALARALEINKRIIPVLADGASLPPESALPDALRGLARRSPITLSTGNFGEEVKVIASALEKFIPTSSGARPSATSTPSPSQPAPAPQVQIQPYQPQSYQPQTYQSQYGTPPPGNYRPPIYTPQQKSGGGGMRFLIFLIILAAIGGGIYWGIEEIQANNRELEGLNPPNLISGNNLLSATTVPTRTAPTATLAPSYKFLETVYVNGGTGAIACTSTYLTSGRSYLFEVAGRFRYDFDNNNAAGYANAQMRWTNSGRVESHSMFRINYQSYIPNSVSMASSAYISASDTISYYWTGAGARVCFDVSDNNYGDNDGTLTVTVKEWR